MARKNYQVDEVLRILLKNPLIKLKDNNVIECSPDSPESKFTIGNSTNGKLSFLEKFGYTVIRLKERNSNVKLKPVKGDVKELVTVEKDADNKTPKVEHIHPAKRKVKSIY
jgi:hypothetical protein